MGQFCHGKFSESILYIERDFVGDSVKIGFPWGGKRPEFRMGEIPIGTRQNVPDARMMDSFGA